MNKKKAIKVLSATAIAASAFVATAPAGTEAAASDVQTLVKKAKDAGTVLKWAISTEGSADGKTRPYAQYNAAKAARDAAVAAINKLPAAQKAGYLADIEQNVNLHINRTMSYIDAITAGEKISAKKATLASQIEMNLIDDATEKAYHELSTEIRKQAILLDRVYGQSTRDEIRAQYKKSAETVRDSVKFEVSVKIELDLAKKSLAANNNADVEKHLAEAVKYMKEVKNVTMKATLTKTLDEVEAQLTPAVKTVSALNAKEIAITFNKAIKADTVLNTTNDLINISIAGTGNPTFKGELSKDKKTLVVTANTGLNGEYTVNINKDSVKAETGEYVKSYISKVNVKDEVAPTLSGTERVNPTTTKIVFSEPISNEGTVSFKYADGSAVNGATFTLDASGKFGTVDLAASTVTTNKEIVVQFIGAKDFANNLITPNPATVIVQKGEKDGVKPTVTSLNVIAPNQLEIKFSEEVNGFTTADITGVTVSKVEKNETDPTKYLLTLASPQEGVKTIGLSASAVTDLSGEENEVYSKLVEFKKDTVAPSLATSAVTKDAKDGKEYLVLTFDKAVTLKDTDGVTLSGSKIKDYVTTNGIDVVIPVNKLVAVEGSATSFKVALADLNLEEGAAYTLSLPTGLVQNVSNVENATKSGAIKFTRGKDTNVAPVAKQTVQSVAKGTGNSQVIVTFGQDVDGVTATDASNYSFDGAVVEKAEILNVDNKKVVTLTLKADSVTFTGLRNYSVSNVKTAQGGTLDNTVKGTINLTENVAPTVTQAVITGPTTIELTFSENLDTTKAGNDFEVFQGTSTTALTESGEAISGNKVTITLSEALKSLDGLVVKASSGINVADSQGNLTTFKEVTVK
ncbi:hypothetical protein [Bacillus sp. FJAT-29937]|uniref:hypothetical protein n=1 Tax=Bacillus sp. FJAT-29937 TaxID=1720553 RepID=UPI00082F180D|nr:hypothetical protein [Bacillus sp. FJAT-29937]